MIKTRSLLAIVGVTLLYQSYPATELLVGTVTFHEKIPFVLHDLWDVRSNDSITATPLKDKCQLLVSGTLKVPIQSEAFWSRGVGYIRIDDGSPAMACTYMTVTGAEVNHQYVCMCVHSHFVNLLLC